MAAQNRTPSKEIQKRISKRGAITDADIQQYIDEVGIANLGDMSMNDVARFLQNYVELGQRKKKLPRKKKIEKTDSVVVVDNQGQVAKVAPQLSVDSGGPMVPSQTGADQQEGGGRPGAFRRFVGSAAGGLLGLGSQTFNMMFPTLGRLMATFNDRIRKQDDEINAVNANNQENARQVSRSSIFLSRIIENQLRTNELLEQIIAVTAPGATLIPQPNTDINVDVDGPDLPRRRGRRVRGAVAGGQASPTQQGGQRTSPPPAASSGSARRGGAALAFTGVGIAFGGAAGAAYAATRSTSSTPNAEQLPSATTAATPEVVQPAIPSLPTPPSITAEAVTRAGAPITEQQQAELFANRVLNIKARDIIFKADRFEFDQAPMAGVAAPAAAPPPVSSRSGGEQAAAAAATATAASGQIQNIVQRITQEFPNVVVTSTLRPNDTNSQHATGNAADLSLRGLTQEQRATLIQNITMGRYGNVGGLGTYNATGDLLHVDTRSGARMAWGPNRSRTSLDQTPQWFQAAVTPWMSGATATAQREQEPVRGGEQMATPAPSRPSTGTQIAQSSVRSEVSTMQSQQVSSTLGEAPQQPAAPTGSVEASATMIDPSEPGSVEPPDAAQRYAKLFNLAA